MLYVKLASGVLLLPVQGQRVAQGRKLHKVCWCFLIPLRMQPGLDHWAPIGMHHVFTVFPQSIGSLQSHTSGLFDVVSHSISAFKCN
jgi:hypothetical protein